MALQSPPSPGDIVPLSSLVTTTTTEDPPEEPPDPISAPPSPSPSSLPKSHLSKARAKRARKVANTSSPTPTPFLRPANDILSRIRHDPSLDLWDYIIGYRDRHEDVMEMSVELWKGGGDITDEEWIPQHRILYFRRESDGVRVWDRGRRLDEVFGSGVLQQEGDGGKGDSKDANSGESEGKTESEGDSGEEGEGLEGEEGEEYKGEFSKNRREKNHES